MRIRSRRSAAGRWQNRVVGVRSAVEVAGRGGQGVKGQLGSQTAADDLLLGVFCSARSDAVAANPA